MPHGKKAASKTPMDAYADGCRAASISTGHPDREIQEIVLTTNLTPRKCLGFKTPFQWKGCSNPLLLTSLRFAPESRPPRRRAMRRLCAGRSAIRGRPLQREGRARQIGNRERARARAVSGHRPSRHLRRRFDAREIAESPAEAAVGHRAPPPWPICVRRYSVFRPSRAIAAATCRLIHSRARSTSLFLIAS
jgi:hypothetical protein